MQSYPFNRLIVTRLMRKHGVKPRQKEKMQCLPNCIRLVLSIHPAIDFINVFHYG